MKYKVTHVTKYSYDSPFFLHENEYPDGVSIYAQAEATSSQATSSSPPLREA